MDVNAHAALFQDQVHAVLQDEIPCRADGPTSRYISQEAWDIRLAKHRLRGRTANRRHDHRHVVMNLALEIWRPVNATMAAFSRLLMHKACLLHELFALAVKFGTVRMKRIIRDDKAKALAEVSSALGKKAQQAIMADLKRLQLGRRKPQKWKRRLPALLKPDGCVAGDRCEVDQLWLEFFGDMEAGVIMPMADFLKAEAAARPTPEVELDASIIPTLVEVEQGLRGVKAHKAAGLDNLPGDVIKKFSKPLARLLHPIMVKSTVYVRQPVQWRGGTLFSAWKGSGSTMVASNYRISKSLRQQCRWQNLS